MFYFFNFVRWYLNHFQVVVYIPKLIIFINEDLISLKDVKFEFLKVVILSLKTMIDRTFFFGTLPPPL